MHGLIPKQIGEKHPGVKMTQGFQIKTIKYVKDEIMLFLFVVYDVNVIIMIITA